MLIKCISPLHIGLISPQICTDLREVINPWKIGGNPPIGGKEYTLDFSAVVPFILLSCIFFK